MFSIQADKMHKHTYSVPYIDGLTFSDISRFQEENHKSIIDHENNKIEIMYKESEFNITTHEYKRCKTKTSIVFRLSNKKP